MATYEQGEPGRDERTDDLVAFLSARLDEDEAAARTAADGYVLPWAVMPDEDGYPGCIADAEGKPVGDLNCDDAAHIARHDPARVLREVAAGCRILARYADALARMEDDDYPAGVARDQAREYEDFVLPNLAVAWSGHPDYRQEWEP